MLKYSIKRLLQSCVTVLIIVTVVFVLMRLLPPDQYFTEEEINNLTEEQMEERLEAIGLLDPIPVQLARFYEDLFFHLDLGVSRRIQSNVPVWDVISPKVLVSMRFGLISLAFSWVLGISFGVLQAMFKDKLVDHIGTGYQIFARAVPGLVTYSLILIFGTRWFNLPSMFSTRDVFRSSILPVICLSFSSTAGHMIWIRRYMVDEMNKDYIRLAKIKGLSTRNIMLKHVLRNAFVPMAQEIPGSILGTISGSLLVERFFSIPGMGPLLTDAISRYDTNIVQALVILYAFLGVLGVFLGDIMMMVFDPRIRLVGKENTR